MAFAATRTLRARVTVLFIGLLVGIMFATITVAGSGITVFARNSAERDMAANARVFEQIIANRESQMRDAAMVVAHDFGFREAFATGDQGTVSSALASLSQRTGSGIAAVIALDGAVTSNAARQTFDGPAIMRMLDGGKDRGVITLDGKLALAVAAPIELPDLAGWLMLAQPLGAHDLQQLGRLSAVPITAEVAPASRLSADLRALQVGVIGTLPSAQGPQLVRLSALPSLQEGIAPRLILRHSLAKAMEGYGSLKNAMILIALGGTIVGIWLSLRIAASITRPLSKLADAARRFGHGEVAKVEVAGDEEVAALATSFNTMVDAIEERERKIVHTALHDGLTGLPNRRFFIEKLDRTVARQTPENRTMIAFIDLDDFKLINDTLGHPQGDALLRHVSKAVQDLFPDAMVARFGGDEFGLLLSVPAHADCTKIASDLNSVLVGDIMLAGRPTALSASFGVAIGPGDGHDSDTLLKNADLALYRAKSEGKGTYQFFEAALDEEARRRRQLELDLRQAVRDGGFELYFQPLYSLAEGHVKGFEALLRWDHPTRGFVGPAEFIPLAEETGLIVPIGDWVIREACAHAAQWPGDLSVAVNISPRQFGSAGLAQTVIQALAASGLAPARLELEITESIFIGNVERTLAVLHSLRALGVRIALDDFGTGYSSLSYLRSFPFDKLKIDQSFVHGLDGDLSAQAIIRAITTLADALGIETLAEGVELNSHMELLRKEGCSMIQGYLISRPVPWGQVAGLIERFGGVGVVPLSKAANG